MTRFSSTDHAAMAMALSDLPFGEQLLLWGIRMWVRSYNKGANIHVKDDSGWSPIHYAKWCSSETVELLLEYGANIDEKTDDEDGKTPIYLAAEDGRVATVIRLLTRRADPYIADKSGRTARDVDRTGYVLVIS